MELVHYKPDTVSEVLTCPGATSCPLPNLGLDGKHTKNLMSTSHLKLKSRKHVLTENYVEFSHMVQGQKHSMARSDPGGEPLRV